MCVCVVMTGRVILLFKAGVSPETGAFGQPKDLAFIEELWPFKHSPTDILCTEFGCVRLYGTKKPVYYVIDVARILGPVPIILNPAAQTIPHNALPKSRSACVRDYRGAEADSSPNKRDGSPFYLLNMWALQMGSSKPMAGDCRGPGEP